MTRRRGWFALALCFVCVPDAQAQADLTITIRLVRMVPSESAFAERCGPRPVRACTRFVGRQLTADCALAGQVWKAHPKAQMGIVTFIPGSGSMVEDASLLSHERTHIADVERDVRAHLHRLRERTFDSVEECRTAMSDAGRRFPGDMDAIQFATNVFRDGLVRKPVTRTAKARN